MWVKKSTVSEGGGEKRGKCNVRTRDVENRSELAPRSLKRSKEKGKESKKRGRYFRGTVWSLRGEKSELLASFRFKKEEKSASVLLQRKKNTPGGEGKCLQRRLA